MSEYWKFSVCTLMYNMKGEVQDKQSRCSIVVSIPACHAGDPGSIPGNGDTILFFGPDLSPHVVCPGFFAQKRRQKRMLR